MREFPGSVFLSAVVLLVAAVCAHAAPPGASEQASTQSAAAEEIFQPLEQWRAAVLAGDAAALAALYSATPPAQIQAGENKDVAAKTEAEYWSALKSSGLSAVRLEILRTEALRADVRRVIFQTEIVTQTGSGPKKLYAPVVHVWVKQGEEWRIAASARDAFTRLRQPLFPNAELYKAGADAKAEIQSAVNKAAHAHKRVLLVFGGNWCYDCHVLDAAFHTAEIAPLLAASFEVVDVDIGQADKNLDVAKKYDVPLEKGVPAIAVLESDGKLLFSQKNGEFEAARKMGPEDLIGFLNRWKPPAGGK